jgi:FAD/FMN-containing dehydrogenase
MKFLHLRMNPFGVLQSTATWNPCRHCNGATTMSSALSIADRTAALSERFSGELVTPDHPDYDDVRRLHNGLVDKRPALIARCRNAADVVGAVKLAQALGLETAVRAGGHNVAGRASVDGGVMIDVSPMKGISVDAERRTARVEAGVTWAELNRATQAHALAVTGGVVSSTGVAGLTLGGGLGWLMGKHGLALDNLLCVELVTAAGDHVRASADERPDLFWAVRGGGGNFGVATIFEFQLHQVGPTVTGGKIAHAFASAVDVLTLFRDATASLPDDQSVVAGLIHAPDGPGEKLAALVTCHCGSLAEGEQAMAPLRRLASPVADDLGPKPYCDLNEMMDGAYPRGALNYWKSSFLSSLSDEAIATMIACFARCPSPLSQIILEHVHGAATRVAVGDTAFPHRAAGYNFLLISQWDDPAMTEPCIAWARETYAAMRPFAAAGRYVNYLDDDEAGDPIVAAYGPNYRRLQEIKGRYDPKNFFRMNQNIVPLAP